MPRIKKTTRKYPVIHDTKHVLLIKQIDKFFAETDISQPIESNYNMPKQAYEVRTNKTKEGEVLNTVQIDFKEPDICNKLIAEGILLSGHFHCPLKYERSETIQVTRCYNCQMFGPIEKKTCPKECQFWKLQSNPWNQRLHPNRQP